METVVKSINRLKVEKGMFNNMLTFLKSRGIKANLIPVKYHLNAEKDSYLPEFRIQGEINESKFIVSISDTEKNLNGHHQVEINIEVDKNKYFTLKPQSNGQIGYMLDNFNPKLISIPELKEAKEPEIVKTKEEPKAEAVKPKEEPKELETKK